MSTAWTCPDCGAPFANPNASHSCVRIELEARFAGAAPTVRAAFNRLVALAQVDGPIPVVAQKTRIVLAAPMRFLAVEVRHDRLVGHVLFDLAVSHPLVTNVLPDAYGSGLFLHRISIRSPDDLDDAFARFVREAAARVGRRERLDIATKGSR
jgi:hypothetical protein